MQKSFSSKSLKKRDLKSRARANGKSVVYLISKAICNWNLSSCWQIRNKKKRSGFLFQEWWMQACVCKQYFFSFFLPSISHIWKQLFEASEMTPHFSRQSHSPTNSPRKMPPIMHQSRNTSNIKKKKFIKYWDPEAPKKKTPRWHPIQIISIHATNSILKHQQALFFFVEENNWEAINCSSSHKRIPKPATHHDNGRSDDGCWKRSRKIKNG